MASSYPELLACLMLCGCASSTIEVDAENPANARAPTTPIEKPQPTLRPGFDPHAQYDVDVQEGQRTRGHANMHHASGTHAGMDHSQHGTHGVTSRSDPQPDAATAPPRDAGANDGAPARAVEGGSSKASHEHH
jgi:hypothetical protein